MLLQRLLVVFDCSDDALRKTKTPTLIIVLQSSRLTTEITVYSTLKVAATLVKFAMLPPMIKTFPGKYYYSMLILNAYLKWQTMNRGSLSTIPMLLSRHQRQDGFGVVVGLLFTGSPRILSIISQLIYTT